MTLIIQKDTQISVVIEDSRKLSKHIGFWDARKAVSIYTEINKKIYSSYTVTSIVK